MSAIFRTRSSSVRVHEQCQRKAFKNQVLGLRDPDSIGKTFGTAYHLDWKAWFNQNKLPSQYTDTGIVARRAMHLYPAPGAGLLVEYGELTDEERAEGKVGAIDEVLADGTVYVGAIDLADARPSAQLVAGRRLWDHKSTINMSYAKTADELRQDVSSVFYARRLREKLRAIGIAIDDMPSRWVYAERIGKKVQAVDFLITGADMRERWGKTLSSVKEMRALHDAHSHGGVAGVKWQDVTPNYDACGDFGGCQFRAQCALAKLRAVNNAPQGQEAVSMGLLGDLQKGVKLGDKVAAPQVPAVVATKATLGARGGSLSALLGKIGPPKQEAPRVMTDAETNPGTLDGKTYTTEDLDSDPFEQPEDGEGEGLAVGVNPIDAPPPDLAKDTIEKKVRKKREKGVATPETEVQQTKSETLVATVAYVNNISEEQATQLLAETKARALARAESKLPQVSLTERIAKLEARIAELEQGAPADTGLANRLAALEAMVGA